jgi:FAD:protein FMN transferase
MGTMVRVEVVGASAASRDQHNIDAAIDRAFDWFRRVEAACSRFDDSSDLRQACARTGQAVPVSDLVFEAVAFAVAVAEESGGAFDPAIGGEMAARGFDRDYRTGEHVSATTGRATYRDIQLDATKRTITLMRPLVIDLGAVAKGLAIDLAARELSECRGFAVDAGGDVFVGGVNGQGEPWSVGVRHPRLHDALIASVRVSGSAVCTSGDYERVTEQGHHLIDARRHEPAADLASVTVVAPSAMVADALATAAFALGRDDGLRLLERHDVQGLFITTGLECLRTREFPG